MNDMKIIDVDKYFEEYIRNYMKQNAGKFTEEEWEDKVPELYESFGKEPLDALDGKSPEGYYASVNAKELCALLRAHVEEEVSVSDYLCDALVKGDTEKGLMEFLSEDEDEELTSYAINILNEKGSTKPLKTYLKRVIDPKTDENMRELMGEVLIDHAKVIKDELIAAAAKAKVGKQFIYEALSGCEKEEVIYSILSEGFKTADDVALFAHLLVRYGDERAIELLKQKISAPKIKYAEFQELKFAIEALGGEYEEQRDFSQDRTYRKIKEYKS